MDVVFVPGGFRFSAHIDEAVEWALKQTGCEVKHLCRDCLATIGQGALERVRADVLITVHGRAFPHHLLREATFPTVVWLVDEPQEVDFSERYGRHFDIVLTNDPNTCGVHGPHKCWYLPLAADPRVHKPGGTASLCGRDLPEAAEGAFAAKRERAQSKEAVLRGLPYEEVDVTFVGGILPERAQLLDEVYRMTSDLRWRVVGPDRYHKDVSFAEIWERRTVTHQEYVDYIRSARIVLDIPRNEFLSFAGRTNRRGIPAAGVGVRPFEVTGCGRFLLTSDARVEIFRLWSEGEIGLYRHGDASDLARQIRYYLEHEEEREEAALAAHQRTMREHTYPVRVRRLLEIVQTWIETRTPEQRGKKR